MEAIVSLESIKRMIAEMKQEEEKSVRDEAANYILHRVETDILESLAYCKTTCPLRAHLQDIEKLAQMIVQDSVFTERFPQYLNGTHSETEKQLFSRLISVFLAKHIRTLQLD